MKYPTLAELPTSREMIDIFKGYNHNLRIANGEFYEMTNLSSDHYPVLSTRTCRGIYASTDIPQGMIAKDTVCYIDGSDFIMGEQRISIGVTEDTAPKTMISMGAYVIIMPDKVYINTENLSDYGPIEASVTATSGASFSLCNADGEDYQDVAVQNWVPLNPENLDFWFDTSESSFTLKQYSSETDTWIPIAITYIKISAAEAIGAPFSVGDGVSISGIKYGAISDIDDTFSSVIWAKGDNYIVVRGTPGIITGQDTAITIERKMPNMDYVIESGNRLWGCRYGIAADNEKTVNEIYASKLGDFKNWNCFAGISTDSYAATVGTDGPFTGAITHLGYPIFFKENCMHKVYGSYPANYQIQTTTCRGVQEGCSGSLAAVNEVLYYKSRSGICAYDGSLPVEVSAALGDVMYHHACAGALGNKYYISMADANEDYHLYVYDTIKDMWHREDDTQAFGFCNCKGDLYYIDHASNLIKTVKGTGVKEKVPLKWSATTGIIGTDSPDKKYISRIDVRMKLDVGAKASFYAEYDSCGDYEYLFTMTGKNLQSFAVPIRPKRCDHMRLRIIGTGEVKIFSICKTIEWGSDR